MKLSTNGTPIYGGYVAVELKNRQGITVWSYFVTPTAGSADISKDLAKRIALHLAWALNQPATPAPASPQSQSRITLAGAGATFPYPIYAKWFTNYSIQYPAVVHCCLFRTIQAHLPPILPPALPPIRLYVVNQQWSTDDRA